MKYLQLPIVGKCSRIALGCDHYGETISEKLARSFIDTYIENGGNLLDTAHMYGQKEDEGPSSSELLLGQYIKGIDRSSIVLATKGGFPHFGDMKSHRLDRRSLTVDITQSLDQLGTYIDVYFLHRDAPELPVSEILGVLNEFISLGYTRAIGASNWSVERIEEANRYAQENNMQGFSFSELQFSLASCTRDGWKDPTLEIMNETSPLSYYEETGLPYMCFTAQAKGLFSKILSGNEEKLSQKAIARFMSEENKKKAERVGILCTMLNAKPEDVVLSYITSQRSNSIAIIGASKLEQIKASLSGSALVLSQEMIEYLDLRRDEIPH